MLKENKSSETAQQSGPSQVTATEEMVTAVPHGIGLAELAASIDLIGSEAASMTNPQAPLSSRILRIPGSPERSDDKKSPVKTSPILGKPKRYALELWVEIEVSSDHFLPPKDDSISEDFARESLDQAYPGCTGVYLERDGHMLAFYGKKGAHKAGLILEVAVEASRAIHNLREWAGYPDRWRSRVISLSEANVTLAWCKQLKRERYRQAMLELRERKHYGPKPFVPEPSHEAASFLPSYGAETEFTLESHDGPSSCHHSAKALPSVRHPGLPTTPTAYRRLQTRNTGETSTDEAHQLHERLSQCTKRRRSRGSRSSKASTTSEASSTHQQSEMGKSSTLVASFSTTERKKKEGFSSKITIPDFCGKEGHANEAASAFRAWARSITCYRDYYQDSYLMPLVVASLKGDAADVFDWMRTLDPNNTQDLSTLLQMLREHYCGSLTFREQRNMVENLHQKSQESGVDFLIQVGKAVHTLAKDWKGELTGEEIHSLQYEVSMNGVREDIRHVLNTQQVKSEILLLPHDMYEAVKKYETYIAHNRRLEGRTRATSHSVFKSPGYKPKFHKTTAFAAAVDKPEDDASYEADLIQSSNEGSLETTSNPEDEAGVFVPNFVEEMVGGDNVLQIKMAQAIHAHEQSTRRCFRCNSPDHLIKDCPKKMSLGPHS